MTTELAMSVSGFLFLSILILYIVILPLLGYVMGDYDPDVMIRTLQKIRKNPNKFKASIIVALIHDVSVITLAIMLFIVFSPYNLILGIAWTIFRVGEGLTLIYIEKSYWGLLNIAKRYESTSGAEKNSLSDLARIILKTKYSRFTFGMLLWSLGTLAFAIVLVTSGVVPYAIGWLGIVAGITVGFYNGIFLVKNSDVKILQAIGALAAIVFEISLGVWLINY